MRLNEMLKQNKEFKTTSSYMERKVDELAEENGALSSQVNNLQTFFCLINSRLFQINFSSCFFFFPLVNAKMLLFVLMDQCHCV